MRRTRRSIGNALAVVLLLGACTTAEAARDTSPPAAPSPAAPSPAEPSRSEPPLAEPSPAKPESPVAHTSTGDTDARPAARPRFAIAPIRGAIRREIVGTNWHAGCPVGPRELRLLRVTYRGFDGSTKRGPLVMHRGVADDVLGVFRRLYRHRFPIKHIALPPRYRPNRYAYDRIRSVTAGFNCRPVTDGDSWSQHAFGLAVDINPVENPYVRGDGSVLRKAALAYRNRTRGRRGMIREGDIVVRSFDRIGWSWGGRWSTIKDYMHFSAGGS
ncbi:MAG: M15 family metallopeptidase [Actinomycetota bacterium]